MRISFDNQIRQPTGQHLLDRLDGDGGDTRAHPNDGLASEKRRSIERQVYAQEYGVGSYAAATANGKLPNPSTSATLSRAVTTRADTRTMVAHYIDSNATLADVRRDDDRTC